jgi:4-aminobutyrate aminotransferase and related aminotransferases
MVAKIVLYQRVGGRHGKDSRTKGDPRPGQRQAWTEEELDCMDRNASLLARRTNAIPRGIASAFPIFADRAENAELWDVNGRRFIDCAGGIAF